MGAFLDKRGTANFGANLCTVELINSGETHSTHRAGDKLPMKIAEWESAGVAIAPPQRVTNDWSGLLKCTGASY
jgi:hypothetical protein